MISFSCAYCGLKIKVKDQYAGRSTKCPTCKQPLVVPQASVTVPWTPPQQIDGEESSLHRIGHLEPGVTLEVERKAAQKQRSVTEALAGRKQSNQRYVIEAEIARGGMGAVLRAIDGDLRREVAVKYMLDDKDAKKRARFIEEAQITGQLEHPNIVPVYDLGVDAQKRPFIMMKLVKGHSLKDVLDGLRANPKASTEWSLNRLLNTFVSICNGVAFAHSRGVINRDLKPANVMLGEFGEVYVMDWGLAKVLKGGHQPAPPPVVSQSISAQKSSKVETSREQEADLTQEGSVLGTPVYMSPEQANGQPQAIDQRSDVYSLGAMLYEMLTLQPPIEKGDYLAILMRVVSGEIVPPEKRTPNRSVPKELSAIAMKALALQPDNRYANVEALRADIERYQEGRTVSAKEDTRRELLWKFVKRNKLASVFTLALAIVLVWSSVVNLQARWQTEQAQAEKDKHIQDSLPTFLRAARLSANEKQFDDALKQLDVVLKHKLEPEALLLKGQINIVRQDFAAAQMTLTEYAKLQPSDKDAAEMLNLCKTATKDDMSSLLAFSRVFHRQQNYPLVDGLLSKYGKTSQEARDQILKTYREIIEKTWPGKGSKLTIDPMGLHLSLGGFKELTDLSPLKGMQLVSLDINGCAVKDLSPLAGMPLTSLSVYICPQIADLRPLKGMSLTRLDIGGCSLVNDLTPLQGMPLTWLHLQQCRVSDLTPLMGMKLTNLWIYNTLITDLTPLKGMALQEVSFLVKDSASGLEVLRQMKSLTKINGGGNTSGFQTSDAFWKRYDAGEFNK